MNKHQYSYIFKKNGNGIYYNLSVAEMLEKETAIDIDMYFKQIKSHFIIACLLENYDEWFYDIIDFEFKSNEIEFKVRHKTLDYEYCIKYTELETMESELNKFMTELESYFNWDTQLETYILKGEYL